MTDSFCIFNGHLISIYEPALSFSNRAFRYGDALFESIRLANGHILFLKEHINRLKLGMTVLRMNVPAEFNSENFATLITHLLQQNQITRDARVRLTVLRNDGGHYSPETNDISFLIETEAIEQNGFVLNQKGLWADLYTDMRKPVNKLSNLKSANALLYVMAGLAKQSMKLDECFIVNDQGNICESISSNVFVVKNGTLYTPPLSEGCVAGVMRQQIMSIAAKNKLLTFETPVTVNTLMNGDEIFLSNSIRGLQWVGQFKQKFYTNKTAQFFTDKLNEITGPHH